jgi:lipid-A-disaccharide synthase
MVIVYRMNALTWQLMKRMAYQPWVGLPNILCREFVVPELIQEQFTVSALVQEANAWLADPQRSQVLQERFEALHVSLRHNTAQSATDAIQTQISA